MTMRPLGTKLEHSAILTSKLRPGMTPEKARDIVREYWKHPDNVAAREQKVGAKAFLEYALWNYTAGMGAGWFEKLPGLITEAEKNPIAWDALREVAHSLAKAQKNIPHELIVLLTRPEGPPKMRHRRPGRDAALYHRDVQLAIAVFHLRNICGFSLSANPTSGRNAFEVVAYATELDFEKVFETVRGAWRHNPLFRNLLKEKKGEKAP